jgi:hypothetical protein
MSPRVPRTRYSDSSRMPSEQCAEESVGRDVHCITISPGNAGRTCTVPHESRVTTTRGRAWLVGRYWQSDLAKLLESKTTSQQQLMSVQVQQSRFPTPMVVIGFPPRAPALSPGSSLLLKMLRGLFPLIPLGTSAIKVSAGASFWCFKMPNMGRRSQNSESC